MSVNTGSKHFDPTMGSPTKELYSMAGLLLMKEFKDWTKDEAIDAYCFDMASFGRTRLMGMAIRRFLTQLKRHSKADYDALEESLRNRYAPGVNQWFADTKKDSESRRLLRRQVAEDMYLLIRRFADTAEHAGRDTYKAAERIFYEQCEVYEEAVIVKNKIGGNVIQNSSDPDATYDGHKGPGYQV